MKLEGLRNFKTGWVTSNGGRRYVNKWEVLTPLQTFLVKGLKSCFMSYARIKTNYVRCY